MCKLKRFRGTKYHNTNVGCIITRLGTIYDQSGCGCVYMDAACGRRPLAQVLRNSLPGHPPLSATKRDTIQNAISSQRRERSYTPVAGDSCFIALLTTGSFTWMLPAVGARSLRCFAIRSLGIRRCLPRHGDTITNAISSQSREGPSMYRVVVTQYEVTIICQTTWRMILLHPLDATH